MNKLAVIPVFLIYCAITIGVILYTVQQNNSLALYTFVGGLGTGTLFVIGLDRLWNLGEKKKEVKVEIKTEEVLHPEPDTGFRDTADVVEVR